MHDRSAGKIQRRASERVGPLSPGISQASNRRPTPNDTRTIDQGSPQNHEHDHSAELHPLGKSAQIRAGVMMKNIPWNSMWVSTRNRRSPIDGIE